MTTNRLLQESLLPSSIVPHGLYCSSLDLVAIVKTGTVLVLSPLVALMVDQPKPNPFEIVMDGLLCNSWC